MELNLKAYFTKFSAIVLALLVVHLLLVRALPNAIGITIQNLLEIYVFLLVLNAAHFFGLRWLFKKWAKYAGLLFTALSMVKMGIAILFLLPYIFPKTESSIAIVLNFMVIYFITLTYEVVYVAKNMTKI